MLEANDQQSQKNQDALFSFTFPTYKTLVCPTTTLQLQTALLPYDFVMPFDGSRNTDVVHLPLVVDSVSMTKLGDFTGLTGCGNRVYTVVTP